jgi:hypothetical protein
MILKKFMPKYKEKETYKLLKERRNLEADLSEWYLEVIGRDGKASSFLSYNLPLVLWNNQYSTQTVINPSREKPILITGENEESIEESRHTLEQFFKINFEEFSKEKVNS